MSMIVDVCFIGEVSAELALWAYEVCEVSRNISMCLVVQINLDSPQVFFGLDRLVKIELSHLQ